MTEQDRALKQVWTAVGIILIVAVTLWLTVRLWVAIAPFVFGVALYVLLNPLAEKLRCRGFSDGQSASLATLTGLLVLVVFIAVLVPVVSDQVTAAIANAPDALGTVREVVTEALDTGSLGRLKIPASVLPQVRAEFESFVSWGVEVAREGAALAFEGAAKAGEWLLNIALAFIVAYWLMRDATRLRREIVLISAQHGSRVDHLMSTATRVSAGYLRGQALACASTSVMVAAALSIIGIPYALTIAVLTFFLDFIPYLGATTSALLALVAGLFGNRFGLSPIASAMLAAGLVVLSRWITDVLVIPKVMSDEVNIHPLIVIAALLVGASGFGVVGILIAIPVAGILQGALVYWWESKTGETLARQDGALFRACDLDEEAT